MSITPAFSPGPWITHGACGRQLLQPHLRGLVGAVLAPHRREDAELDHGGRAAHDGEHALVLVGRQAVLGHDLRRDRGLVGQLDRRVLLDASTVATAPRPGPRTAPCRREPPNIGSTAFSGCGISPITVLVSLKTPAMLLDRAVGIAGAVDRAVGRAVAERHLAAILDAASACRRRRSSCPRHGPPARGSPGPPGSGW